MSEDHEHDVGQSPWNEADQRRLAAELKRQQRKDQAGRNPRKESEKDDSIPRWRGLLAWLRRRH